MVRPDHIGGDAATVLSWLWDLDARAGGYTRRGVRGWARREDVEAGTKLKLPELLPRLRGRGLVEEDPVHMPGTRSVGIYRITGLGDLLLARHQGREALPPWPTGASGKEDEAVHLPPGSSIALRLLRDALSDPRPPRYPGLGLGWRTEKELREQLDPASEWVDPECGSDGDRGPWLPGDPPWKRYPSPAEAISPEPPAVFDGVDLAWLERARLIQRTTITPAKRKRAVTLWRLRDAGAEIRELVWHPPRDPQG